jgi:predicted amidohydrolase YtcJ
MKAVCDGSISERTARLSQAYVNRPNDYGILVADEDELYPLARKAHEAGWQIGIHANGDVAIDIVVNIYERLQREYPRHAPQHLKGSVQTGKLANLVVLGRDPFREDPSSLISIPIERTMVGGRRAYES